MDIEQLARATQQASWQLANSSAEQRSALLMRMAEELEAQQENIQRANQNDCQRAEGRLSKAMLDRLTLTDSRFKAMVQGVREVAAETDLLGEVLDSWQRPNGLLFEQRRVALGVVAIIYESRPNVTADAAAICIRSGNAALLRGGSEAIETNRAIAKALRDAADSCALDSNVISFIDSSDRSVVEALLKLDDFIDVVIPRGGEGLIRAVCEHSRIPVLKHFKGVCHLFVDESALVEPALAVCRNAKMQRPGVCNAVETILVHAAIAKDFLPQLAAALPGVEIRGCEETCQILSTAVPATEADWSEEYLDLIVSVRVVADLDIAVRHITAYGSKHTDGILSQNESAIAEFLQRIDSGVLVVNASTRFNDGAEFGKGAEIGISTDKLHARGPVGAKELTTYKYVVRGEGTVRE